MRKTISAEFCEHYVSMAITQVNSNSDSGTLLIKICVPLKYLESSFPKQSLLHVDLFHHSNISAYCTLGSLSCATTPNTSGAGSRML